jgi:hypothetical protein
MVVGLAAAALQGAPAVTQDVDLWFGNLSDPGIHGALRKVGGSYVPPMGLNPPMFAGECVKLFDIALKMDGLRSFEEEIKQAKGVTEHPSFSLALRWTNHPTHAAISRATNRPCPRRIR